MIGDRTSLLIFIKYPREGRVKTRLAASIGEKAATLLYRDFVEISLARFQKLKSFNFTIYFDPYEEEDAVRHWLGDRFLYRAQPEGHLGIRLQAGFNRELQNYPRVIIIGSDSPDVPLEYIERGALQLQNREAVIGPAMDGGYYLIGLSRPIPELFHDIPWSTNRVFQSTIDIVKSRSIDCAILPEWYDVDTESDFMRLLNSCDPSVQLYLERWNKIGGRQSGILEGNSK